MNPAQPLVVHVMYSFAVGGLENGVVNLINRLPTDRYRHAVLALSHCDEAYCRRVSRPDVTFLSLHKPPGHALPLYPKLFRLFRQWRPSIVHTRNLAALEVAVPAWAAGVPARIHGEHGWDTADRHGENLRHRRIRKLYRPFVNRYVALSRHIEGYLSDQIGIRHEKIARICNGVDSDRFKPPSDGRRIAIHGSPFNDPGLRVVGTVGRLQAVKDQSTLVRAFARLVRETGSDAASWRLVIVGDGPQRADVETEIARQQVSDRVWLAGERSDIPDILRGLDVFALPSQSEGISNTILEAMACGLPVVATDVGGNAELVVPEATGALVPASDDRRLAAALGEYVRDRALAVTHGQAGRQRVEAQFSLNGMVDRYAALYASVCSNGDA